MVVKPQDGPYQAGRKDWGAIRARMVARLDKVVNWERRGRTTRHSHTHHHMKSKRMEH